MMCLFISYKSPDQLKQVKSVADKIKADMRVLVIESMKSSSEAEKVDELASKNEFETVYLKPNKEQRRDAEEHSEKVGVERLIETIEVCNWPWRICNAVAKGKIPTVMQENHTGDIEEKMGDGVNITDPVAELLMNNYQEWQKKQQVNASKIPAPQRAERVHLSDSPTTTEGTTNPDDASISVDIDLTKNQEENETRSREKNDEEEKSVPNFSFSYKYFAHFLNIHVSPPKLSSSIDIFHYFLALTYFFS
ncbi:hypothetical protein CAEBREN_10181 [Caenorhabditis brenneri]|uniref:Uncharacterized protein n=1 Tax=Caenorhabditis brenneri TaxID=135651 RepID=G0P0W5_CAEBE|nr:hypothetical protein CAEBREN_10181 [Caenorhabditis brenneri]